MADRVWLALPVPPPEGKGNRTDSSKHHPPRGGMYFRGNMALRAGSPSQTGQTRPELVSRKLLNYCLRRTWSTMGGPVLTALDSLRVAFSAHKVC